MGWNRMGCGGMVWYGMGWVQPTVGTCAETVISSVTSVTATATVGTAAVTAIAVTAAAAAAAPAPAPAAAPLSRPSLYSL